MPSEGAIEEAKDFRDKMSTVDHDSGKRVWIFAKKPFGKLYNLRTYVSWGYLLLFFIGPFLEINGNPLLMINVVEGKFSILGKMFWPQDFFIFGLGMLIFIVFIILFTLVFGRVFCGWVCPQTIFMEMVFRKIEYLIEGDMGKQKVLARQKWDTEKILKKGTKHIIFFLLSFLIANTFLAYILGKEAMRDMITHPADNVGTFVGILIFTAVFYGVYAYVRETVCTNICPYGRLQGVLMDKDSIVVAYDHVRGENRGKFRKDRDTNLGDCIDCHQCVDVCPTGIDIRNGTQLECVNCTACIDACNFMMDKVGYEPGLIRYASENSIANKQPLKITTRIKVFSGILIALIAIMSFTLISRKDLDTTILRTAGKLYYEMDNDTVGNLYSLKIINKTSEDINLLLKPEAKMARIKMAGEANPIIPKAAKKDLTFFILYHKKGIKEPKQKIDIDLIMNGEKKQSVTAKFIGPMHIE